MKHNSLAVLILSACVSSVSSQASGQDALRFDRDVRPILSDRCFRCHGPDERSRKAGLRLDTREGLFGTGDGGRVVVAGDPAASLLMQRVRHAEDGERMPPPSSGKTLNRAEIEVLARWIEEGAAWEEHWAYRPVARPRVPEDASAWAKNDIDRLLMARWRAIGVEASPPAAPRTLVRRLYMDMLGLPPDPATVERFAREPSDAAWGRLVDEVLASPHHAERLAMYWLDLVRYADSCGIHGDQEISMSPYRDWVIRAFHENKPFDAFTREQLAGDLLPNATREQRIASGYNRLNPKTAEGGAQDKEYLAKNAADRVRTTATTWLGSTLGCAECHDHKFDPFTTRDFYRFAAFFADLEQKGYYGGANTTGNWGPKLVVPTAAQIAERGKLVAEMSALRARYERSSPELVKAQRAWELRTRAELARAARPRLGPWSSAGPFRAKSLRAAHDTAFDVEKASRAGAWRARPAWTDGKLHALRGENSATYLRRTIHSESAQELELSLGSDDSIKLWLNGLLLLDKYVMRGAAPGQEKPRIALRPGRNELLLKISNGGGRYAFYFDVAQAGPPPRIAKILRQDEGARADLDARALGDYFRSVTPLLQAERNGLAKAEKALARLEQRFVTSLVSEARAEPRMTRVLARGDWQDESGEVVEPGFPAFMLRGASAEASRRLTRLDLANWLTSRSNPLTARVMVNRLWKLLFGRGLSRTLDDLGSQGHRPEHGELLDYLADDFVRRGWDLRAMLRTILTSAAYRQSSRLPVERLARDPENREFARQARFRLDAEVLRDNALAISGLLDRSVGGPSVKPYQPAGYWGQLNFPKRRWVHDTGSEQYRRGVYTHWQRTFLHPSLVAFDAPPREACTAERDRSNTPLQALVLLNDPSFVEAARVLAARTLQSGPEGDAARIAWIFRRALARTASARESARLLAYLGERREYYATRRDAAEEITGVGLWPRASKLDAREHAAWAALARVVLNLRETTTRY